MLTTLEDRNQKAGNEKVGGKMFDNKTRLKRIQEKMNNTELGTNKHW